MNRKQVTKKKSARAARPVRAKIKSRAEAFNLNHEFLVFARDTRSQMEQIFNTLRALCQQSAELKEPFTQQSVLSLHKPLATLNDSITALRADIERARISSRR